MAKLFQTGDSTNDNPKNVTLQLSNDVWLRRAFLQALMLLTNEDNWQQDGTATIDYARDKAVEAYVSINWEPETPTMIPVGATMIWHMTGDIPDRWLECDGSGHLIADYPELYAVLGSTYGSGGGFFGVPSMSGRSPYGVTGTINVGDTAGALTHTLDITEIPSHSHNLRIGTAAGTGAHPHANTNQAAQATTYAALVATGGGLAHNNLHPVLGVRFIIYAGNA